MDKAAYQRIKTLVLSGHFSEIREIADAISMRQLQADLGMGHQALSRRLIDPDRFSVGELRQLAGLIGVEANILFGLALAQKQRKKK